MPSPSVSVSPVSVSVSVSAPRPAAAGVATPVDPGAGFQQLMRHAEDNRTAPKPESGDALPSNGKDLPAQRQQGSKDSAGDAQVAVSEGTAETGSEAHADSGSGIEGAGEGKAEESKAEESKAEGRSEGSVAEAPGETGEAEPEHAADIVNTDDEQSNDSAQLADDDAGEDPKEAGQNVTPVIDLPSQGLVAAEGAVDGAVDGAVEGKGEGKSHSAAVPAAEVDAKVSLSVEGGGLAGRAGQGQELPGQAESGVKPGVEAAVPAVAEGGHPEGERRVSSESSVNASGNNTSVKGRATSEIPPLPGQAARPEVREAALQNGGQARQEAEPATPRAGSPVAEVARAEASALPAQAEPGSAESQPVESQQAGARPGVIAPGIESSANIEAVATVEARTEQLVSGRDAVANAQLAAQSQPAVAAAAVEQIRTQSNDDGALLGARTPDGGQSGARPGADLLMPAANQNPQGGQNNAGLAQVDQQLSQQGPVSAQSGAAAQAQSADTDQPGASSRNAGTLFSTEARVNGDAATLGTQAQQQSAGAMQPGAATPRGEAAAAALAQRLQDPAWGWAMGQRAVMMAQYGPRSAEIQLDPPELGAMQVRVHLNGKDQVSVSFTSPHPQVREAIEQQLPRLKEMFAEQGMDLNQSSVSDQSARERQDDSGGDRNRQSGSQAYGDSGGTSENLINVSQAPVGLVDYYA
ncbi:flagellar hook-length control protein FliK [Marinobacterium lutimaris]|uniref:Hook-length control protein FliK n=1 Tax=Marinobacterium lutimaris TaxID=568106 RepID=A0A1H6BCD1_9GAMM|nr:flagellar hook-length control protein FliK [Marinobacterium lutimaris]SEG58282.1 hook-length control protein FliK [Marinobacterium lutimaris]